MYKEFNDFCATRFCEKCNCKDVWDARQKEIDDLKKSYENCFEDLKYYVSRCVKLESKYIKNEADKLRDFLNEASL